MMIKITAGLVILLFVINMSISTIGTSIAQNSATPTNTTNQESSITNHDLLLLNINLNRIEVQMNILLEKINNNNNSLLFEHAYIPHSVIFPSIKDLAISIDEEQARSLEVKLTDIPLQIQSNQDPSVLINEINAAKEIIGNFYSILKGTLPSADYSVLESQTLSYLLRDSQTSYEFFLNSSRNSATDASANYALIDYENSLGLVNQSSFLFNLLKPNMTDAKAAEIEFFISNLNDIILTQSNDLEEYSKTVSAIERDLNEFNNIPTQNLSYIVDPSLQIYYDNIDVLLNNALSSVQNGDYLSADKNVSSAYLDNYEYLEAPIEEVNSTLMVEIEIDMRENLRELIKSQAPIAEIQSLVSKIKENLEVTKQLLGTTTNAQSTVDPSLQIYYDNIDVLLNNALSSVQNGDYLSADKNVSSAYLDNYEYLEAPIEEVNSTLMVEIEIDMRENLRELIKSQAPIAEIQSLVSKIKENLEVTKQLLGTTTNAQLSSPTNNLPPSSFVPNVANIDSLREGFGIYTGERRAMGEASEDFKGQVRNDIDTIRVKLDEVISQYAQNDSSQALATARSAYLDSYENIEIPLRPIDPDFTLEMEIKFAELRNLISSNSPVDQVVSKVAELKNGLDESERFVSGIGSVAPAIAFSSSFSIIFREGLESALILGAILTYLEATRNERFKKHIYSGILLAIVLTAVTWYIAQFIIEISGAQRELIEAIAGISAVAVLFWVSFWVLNKIETKKWIEFVKAKVWQATTTGSVMVFVMLSFVTVYREGFETVLFYQALFSFAKYMELYVLAGLVLGLAVILGVVFIVRRLGKKLPLRVLFGLTMGIGAFMSITFLGNALREFQELGWIPTTHLFGIIPRFDINIATMTGIHPTLETVVGQIILFLVYIVGSLYILIIRPRKQQAIASMRKSVGDRNKEKRQNG